MVRPERARAAEAGLVYNENTRLWARRVEEERTRARRERHGMTANWERARIGRSFLFLRDAASGVSDC